ncbi:MAG: DUF4440 domain-containing protein [Gammaproteobacteria bacterium]|nr:DUF4440 domain-containing protein [Gammaproteobacteria bacterium]
MKLLHLFPGLLLAVVFAPVAVSGTNHSIAIEESNLSWVSALNKGNTKTLLDVYTEDAVVMPPSSEILSDHAAIKTYWDGLLRVGVGKYAINTVDLRIEGDTAYQTALWEATRVAADGNVIHFDGNMSTVYEQQKDGSWKIKLQSWN